VLWRLILRMGEEELQEQIAELENKLRILREMCIEREVRIEGEWGNGLTDSIALGVEIDQELKLRMIHERSGCDCSS
jgi:hypothetical protein